MAKFVVRLKPVDGLGQIHVVRPRWNWWAEYNISGRGLQAPSFTSIAVQLIATYRILAWKPRAITPPHLMYFPLCYTSLIGYMFYPDK